MGTTELTKDNFEQAVAKDGIVLVDWWAPWCGPCRSFGPIYESVSQNHPDITFGKINTEEQQELASAFEIRSIPTLMIFRDRVLLFAQPGSMAATAVEDLIRQTRALDMKNVHQKLADRDRETREKRPKNLA